MRHVLTQSRSKRSTIYNWNWACSGCLLMQLYLPVVPTAFVLTANYRVALTLLVCATLAHAQGIITTIAGGGQFQVTGVGGPATNVPLGVIRGVATDPQGNVYAADVAPSSANYI